MFTVLGICRWLPVVRGINEALEKPGFRGRQGASKKSSSLLEVLEFNREFCRV